MNKKFTILAILYLVAFIMLVSKNGFGQETRIKIAVVDTGIIDGYLTKYLCEDGHKDFSNTSLTDTQGHGTHIATIISQGIDPTKHCLMIIKWFDSYGKFDNNTVKAFEYVKTKYVRYLNFSAGGIEPIKKEETALKGILSQDVVVVVAAGNNSSNLDNKCNFHPACYNFNNTNYHVAGGTQNDSMSNYGKVVTDNENTTQCVIINNKSVCLTGTSQAAARVMNKLIKKSYEQ